MSSYLPVVVADRTIDELAGVVRAEIEQAQTGWRNALRHAMNAGDALSEVQPKVAGNWKKWLRTNCFVSVRTAQLYQQLARHREKIESAIQSEGPLSLRSARRLISNSSTKSSKKSESLVDHWKREPAAARSTFLDAIGVDAILAVMSADFGRQLRDRAPASKGKPQKKFKTLNLTASESTVSGTTPGNGRHC
jgi:hypothetical protein